MGYLLVEIGIYLVIAGLIGFIVGWLVRGGGLDKYFAKTISFMKKIWIIFKRLFKKVKSRKVKKELEEIVPKVVIEVIKEEVKTKVEASISEEIIDNTSIPILFTQAPESGIDKLSSIKGIGPVLEKKLNELGIYSFKQIASWDTEQEIWIGRKIAFSKRVSKEAWVKQAKELLKTK